jgi:hypothetical protein
MLKSLMLKCNFNILVFNFKLIIRLRVLYYKIKQFYTYKGKTFSLYHRNKLNVSI